MSAIYMRCSHSGCDWGYYLLDDSAASTSIYNIAHRDHLDKMHAGKDGYDNGGLSDLLGGLFGSGR